MNNSENINEFVPSLLNPKTVRRDNISLTQNSIISKCSLSLRKNNAAFRSHLKKLLPSNKENCNINTERPYNTERPEVSKKPELKKEPAVDKETLSFSAINDIDIESRKVTSSPLNFSDIPIQTIINNPPEDETKPDINKLACKKKEQFIFSELNDKKKYLASVISDCSEGKTDTEPEEEYRYIIPVTLGLKDCHNVDLSTIKSNIKNISIARNDNHIISVSCDLIEGSQISSVDCEDATLDDNMNELPKNSPQKRHAVAVQLEIKKMKHTIDVKEDSKVLFLKTNAIEKISHVIAQPPNFVFVKKYTSTDDKKFKKPDKSSSRSFIQNKNGFTCLRKSGDGLKQSTLDGFFKSNIKAQSNISLDDSVYGCAKIKRKGDCVCPNDDVKDMSKLVVPSDSKNERKKSSVLGSKKDNEPVPKSVKTSSAKLFSDGGKKQDLRLSHSVSPSSVASKAKESSIYSPIRQHSPRRNVEYSLATNKNKSPSRTSSPTKVIPHYKVVAGTHFAVDAFSYGDIPNVKHYFLTHFHSDHYVGLKKNFNQLLYCSKITAELCVSRIGVNPKHIQIINVDECIKVEGVEVTAVDANHCPGAVMLIFTLGNGKTILHTGDFRASPIMETYPIFWNKDIHTIYLDTTYCNPRYDFPTQDQSLEMALNFLRIKKCELEKTGKKFSSVLIVCGTYTIGKEKFFLGVASRVGCNVWACPEKDRVLRAVEGRSFTRSPPSACQLHVVPMRDLTVEKLRSYLESLGGAFTEVVAFKPSGWENGKNTTVEKDQVTIHGIPYSEHSSFSELIRFVKFLKPRQVVPTVDIAGGVKSVQKYFPCPLVYKEDLQNQSKMSDFFSIQNRQQLVLPKSYFD